jgi:hypothetical protein
MIYDTQAKTDVIQRILIARANSRFNLFLFYLCFAIFKVHISTLNRSQSIFYNITPIKAERH